MKVKLRDYHVIGAIGKRALLIHKDLQRPFYIATEEDDTESNGWKIPAGMTFAVTVLIRNIDSKNFQASMPLLLVGFLVVFLSVEWIYRKFPHTILEVEEFHFENISLEEVLIDATKRNNTLMKFFIVFLLVTLIFAILYLYMHLFIFLFLSLGMFVCTALLAKYQIFKRMFVLHKIKKEYIR
ncbi:hypothetical protein Q7W37_02165 [Streptococcus suis]|nr:hypothetical protein [Streptococcus suis]